MPIEFSVNVAYDDIYDDYTTIDIDTLIIDIPTKMALALICHYSAQVHTQEKNPAYQIQAIREWCRRFHPKTIQKLQIVINRFNASNASNFNFVNNVSSLYLIEYILEHHNNLPPTKDLTPIQEENLFKAYLFFSAKWTKEQEIGAIKYRDISTSFMALVMMLPYAELFEFKDFRIQFLKAVYFFKFCEENDQFKIYLDVFLTTRGVTSWNQYLFNLLSVYITLLAPDGAKSVLTFENKSKDVFSSLERMCLNIENFKHEKDFLTIRPNPIYKYSENELLFLDINFLIDKIYQGVIFDFSDVLLKNGVTYNGKAIKNRQQFLGIFGDDFIEPGLFYQVMKYVFRQRDYEHLTGDELKSLFGEGTPDYLIIDNRKLYVFEFKNTFFSGAVKYSFDIELIKKELNKKFVQNESGKPKGITQLVNFINDLYKDRYSDYLDQVSTDYIIYPILVTTDFTFNLPVIYSFISDQYKDALQNSGLLNSKLQIKPITLIDFDLIIKFQDLFISKRLTINHLLNDYQVYLARGNNEIDKSLSFNKYLHDKTSKIKYDSPKLFMEEIKSSLF